MQIFICWFYVQSILDLNKILCPWMSREYMNSERAVYCTLYSSLSSSVSPNNRQRKKVFFAFLLIKRKQVAHNVFYLIQDNKVRQFTFLFGDSSCSDHRTSSVPLVWSHGYHYKTGLENKGAYFEVSANLSFMIFLT